MHFFRWNGGALNQAHLVSQPVCWSVCRCSEDAPLTGKPVAVFTTYKLAIGSTLQQMSMAAESAGGKVTGMYKVKGPNVPDGFESWVGSLDSDAAV